VELDVAAVVLLQQSLEDHRRPQGRAGVAVEGSARPCHERVILPAPPTPQPAAPSTGSSTVNVDPTPRTLSTVTRPPWRSAALRTSDNPRPVPPSARLRALSTR